ncbi:MAG: alanine--tRNA ligase [Desulfurococcales archaeon]|nr:alanine--tRNA ligase [Desulfurococcales archaeon]
MSVDPAEYALDFFREHGFQRRIGKRCKEYYWTLNPDFEEPQDTPCVEYWFERVPSRSPLDVEGARRLFIDFFTRKGHEPVKPRPVVARWREDLYLTIASIVVFQPHVTSGLVPPPANPLVISQPSIRLEDIDNVGVTIGRHLTSFEMAAHHAFNYPDKWVYWKEETVRLAYEFFTKEMGIPGDMIVFKESWWEGGGNAGPSFEVTVGGLELATLVFMKYRVTNGGYEEIPLKIVDTGYGVERLAWFTRKTPTAFHTIYGNLLPKYRGMIGLHEPPEEVLWAAYKAAGRLDPEDEASLDSYYHNVANKAGLTPEEARKILEREARVYSVLDHAKTLMLMLADGVVPSNSGEGYLARLVLRRALRQLRVLSADVSIVDLVDMQVQYWGSSFPQAVEMRDYIIDVVSLEEKRFKDLISKGGAVVEKELKRKKRLSLDDLVRLYDSRGIPPELVAEIAAKRGVEVKVPANFYSIVASMHKQPSKEVKAGEKIKLPQDVVEWARGFPPTRPLFHENPYMNRFTGKVLGVRGSYVILDQTAFYPTGGGQIHDTGLLIVRGSRLRVVDVQSVGDVVVHKVEGKASLDQGDTVEGVIDWRRRYRIMRHHTATHALIAAARKVLGRHAWQAGAEKTEEKGRLDVTHYKPLTKDDIRRLEEEVNSIIDMRIPVEARLEPKNEAEEKYGYVIYQGGVPMKRDIRIVEIKGVDVEACYGTHVSNTGEIGGFKIINYERIQDGVVRLEYVAGTRIPEEAGRLEDTLADIAETVRASRGMEVERVKGLLEALRSTEETVRRYRKQWIESLEREAFNASTLGGIKLLVAESVEDDKRGIQEVLRRLTSAHKDLVAAIVYPVDGDTQVEIALGHEVAKRVDAGQLAKSLANALGGRGGGKGSRASIRLPGRVSAETVRKVLESSWGGRYD